jgi:prepilin-type N-terminal cleavage/methylation domain-containing protein
MFRNEKGFTLIELMVVVLIIGILVAVAIPVFGSAAENARDKACDANLRTIDGAIAQYQSEFNVIPTTAAELTGGSDPLLKAWPDDPHPGEGPYTIAGGVAKASGTHNPDYSQ